MASKPWSFRLNPNNPRHAAAQRQIEQWMAEGFSLAHILTSCVLAQAGITIEREASNSLPDNVVTVDDLRSMLSEFGEQLLGQLGSVGAARGGAVLQEAADTYTNQLANAIRQRHDKAMTGVIDDYD